MHGPPTICTGGPNLHDSGAAFLLLAISMVLYGAIRSIRPTEIQREHVAHVVLKLQSLPGSKFC